MRLTPEHTDFDLVLSIKNSHGGTQEYRSRYRVDWLELGARTTKVLLDPTSEGDVIAEALFKKIQGQPQQYILVLCAVPTLHLGLFKKLTHALLPRYDQEEPAPKSDVGDRAVFTKINEHGRECSWNDSPFSTKNMKKNNNLLEISDDVIWHTKNFPDGRWALLLRISYDLAQRSGITQKQVSDFRKSLVLGEEELPYREIMDAMYQAVKKNQLNYFKKN